MSNVMNEDDVAVVICTATDPDNDCFNILDGKIETFWKSTGLFPQELVLKFRTSFVNIQAIKISSCFIKKFKIETTEKTQPVGFKTLVNELTIAENEEDKLQVETFNVSNVKARYIKFTIVDAYKDFTTLNTISIIGKLEDVKN